MPYKSKAQLRFMHAKHPAIAKRWDKEYGPPGDIPEKVEHSPRPTRKARVKGGK